MGSAAAGLAVQRQRALQQRVDADVISMVENFTNMIKAAKAGSSSLLQNPIVSIRAFLSPNLSSSPFPSTCLSPPPLPPNSLPLLNPTPPHPYLPPPASSPLTLSPQSFPLLFLAFPRAPRLSPSLPLRSTILFATPRRRTRLKCTPPSWWERRSLS
ncbi:unnamed protein product [Closterium sp. Naga37s-1]|nr:unnamed protein product [Closterium sp. Naga37s-1]